MTKTFPCSFCAKNVNVNHRAVCCDICNRWIHIKCNNLNQNDYFLLKNDPNPFDCICSLKDNVPFTNLTNNELILVVTKGVNTSSDNSNIFNYHTPQMQTHIKNLNEYLNKLLMPPTDDDDDEDCLQLIATMYILQPRRIFKIEI